MLYSSIRGSWGSISRKHVRVAQFDLTVEADVSHARSCRSHLSEVELQRVVSGQRDHESSGQVLGQRVSMVAQEQAVVAQR